MKMTQLFMTLIFIFVGMIVTHFYELKSELMNAVYDYFLINYTFDS